MTSFGTLLYPVENDRPTAESRRNWVSGDFVFSNGS